MRARRWWDPDRPGSLAWLLLSLALFTLVSAGGVLFHSRAMEEARSRLAEHVVNEALRTSTIAEDYVSGLRRQAWAAQQSPFLAEAIESFVNGGRDDPQLESMLQRRLDSERSACGLSSMALLEPHGSVLLKSEAIGDEMLRVDAESVDAARTTGAIQVVDRSTGAESEMCLLIPIHRGGEESGPVVALLCEQFTIAQQTVLVTARHNLPYIRSYLVRRRGAATAVICLDDCDVEFEEAISGSQSPSDMQSGKSPPLWSEHGVAGTQWSVVVAADSDEMTRPARTQTGILAIVSLLAFCSAGVAIRPLWVQRSGEYRRLLEETRMDRDLLTSHVDLLSKNANDIILLVDEDYRVVFFNDRALEAYGLSGRDLANAQLTDLVDEKVAGQCAKRLENIGDGAVYESIHLRSDGSAFPVECSVRSINVDGQSFYQFIVRDITSRHSSELEIRRYQTRLKALASELVLAEERERHRIATLLHDSVGQNLAVLSLRLQMGAAANDCDQVLREAHAAVDDCLAETRSLTCELSPPMLHELGLEPALDWLAEQFRSRHGLAVRVVGDGRPKRVGKDVSSALFSSVRELLMNVVKHARATQTTVEVERREDQLLITVTDDGVGLNIDSVVDSPWAGTSFGLFSIRERVEYFGGLMFVDSKVGQGTSVTLIAPLEPTETGEGLTGGAQHDDQSSAG